MLLKVLQESIAFNLTTLSDFVDSMLLKALQESILFYLTTFRDFVEYFINFFCFGTSQKFFLQQKKRKQTKK